MIKNIEPIAFNAFRCWTASAREQMPGLIINEEDDQKISADFKAVLIDAMEFLDKQYDDPEDLFDYYKAVGYIEGFVMGKISTQWSFEYLPLPPRLDYQIWFLAFRQYARALLQAKLARRIGTLDGILWHQGENDSFSGRSATYFQKLEVIVEAFRRELDAPDILFIAGGLGDFLSSGRYGQYFTEYQKVNQTLLDFANTKPNCYFVSAAGLSANPDDLHFNAVSLRKFGIRYFKAWHQHTNVLEPISNEDATVNIITSRPLTKTERIALLKNLFARGETSVEDFELALEKLETS